LMGHYDPNRFGIGKEYIGDIGSDSRSCRHGDCYRPYAWPGNSNTERIRACTHCYLRSYVWEKPFWKINEITVFITVFYYKGQVLFFSLTKYPHFSKFQIFPLLSL
jgi:hypothetical protein